MKYLLITIALTLLFNPVSAQVNIKHLSIKKVEKMNYVQHDIDELRCPGEDGEIDPIILFEFSGVAPEATDAQKAEVIQKLDLWIKKLEAYSDCSATHTIIIKLSEGTFLKKSDDIEPYSKAYFKKGYALAAKRFKARYKELLGEILNDKTIILTDWNW